MTDPAGWIFYTDCNGVSQQYYLETGQEVTFCALQSLVFTTAQLTNNGVC